MPKGTASKNDQQEVERPAHSTESEHPFRSLYATKNTDQGGQVQGQPDRAVDHTCHCGPGPFSPQGGGKAQRYQYEKQAPTDVSGC